MWHDISLDTILDIQQRMRHGCTMGTLLRYIVDRWCNGVYDAGFIIKHLSAAFHLSSSVLIPILQWRPDSVTQVSDEMLNRYILPEIVRKRDKWSTADAGWMAGLDWVEQEDTASQLCKDAWDKLTEADQQRLTARFAGTQKTSYALRVMCRLAERLDRKSIDVSD